MVDKEQKLSPDLDAYLDLRRQQENIDEELAALNRDITALDQDYGERREKVKNYREKELCHIHKKQREEMLAALKAKQREEEQKVKEDYQHLKIEQEQKRNALLEQHRLKAESKKALQEDLERRKSAIDVDQLLEFVHSQQSASKKRKRRDGGDEVQG
jgi:hypothetical protein